MDRPKYKGGEKIQVWTDLQPHGFKNAILLAPRVSYCGDWEYQYLLDPRPETDSVSGITPSQGGYTTERFIRDRE